MKPVSLKGSEKICKVCGAVKPMNEFPKRGNHRLNSCSSCYKVYENYRSRIRYREDSEYRKSKLQRTRVKHRYNTTPEQVQQTLEAQNYKCANSECRVDISFRKENSFEKQAVIDHNHETGKFRSLLCQRCNLILGYLEKRPKTIIGLQKYLQEHLV